MYTRCTGCHTVHPVNAALLSVAGGRYRCGKCNKVGNALEALFDEWPDPGAKPAAAGPVPELGLPIDLTGARDARGNPGDIVAPKAGARTTRFTRLAWISMALIVAGAITWKLMDYFDPPPVTEFRDLSQIHLVSRELRSHPDLEGTLRLTATIVNRSQVNQPYPDLEVLLIDASGTTVSRAVFRPADYLADAEAGQAGMTPQAYLPLILDLADPGNEAVGFELNFL